MCFYFPFSFWEIGICTMYHMYLEAQSTSIILQSAINDNHDFINRIFNYYYERAKKTDNICFILLSFSSPRCGRSNDNNHGCSALNAEFVFFFFFAFFRLCDINISVQCSIYAKHRYAWMELYMWIRVESNLWNCSWSRSSVVCKHMHDIHANRFDFNDNNNI